MHTTEGKKGRNKNKARHQNESGGNEITREVAPYEIR
jgi:hypothetical protein